MMVEIIMMLAAFAGCYFSLCLAFSFPSVVGT
jgi:hypothetical protein